MTAAIENLIRCERDQSKVIVVVEEDLVKDPYVALVYRAKSHFQTTEWGWANDQLRKEVPREK
jgi:hypothetical protein